MTHKCEHGDSDRFPSGGCRVCYILKRPAYREKANENARRWRSANREKANASVRRWARANPEKLREYQRRRWRDNPEKINAIVKRSKWKMLGISPTRPPPGQCESCGDVFLKTPHLDHCHSAMKFRGWLCNSCNNGLGRFKDDPERLKKAIAYLEKYG